MFRRWNKMVLFLLLLSFAVPQFLIAQKTMKKRIAVFLFDDKTDHRVYWWRHNQPVGHGMSEMLTTALVKSGKYTVIERQELEKIMQEQRLGQSGLVTPQTAAEVGKLLGVELAVMGAVTEFGYSQDKKGLSFKGIGGGVKTMKATVAVDVRLVNTSTGEIIAAENVRKEKKSRGVSFHNQKINFKDQKDFDESIVGKATRDAIETIVKLIDEQMKSIPWSGRVIMEKNGEVYVNAGSETGLEVGDKLEVFRPGEELIDPETGLNLGTTESKIGVIEISQDLAQGKASKARIISGSGFMKGDIVRLVKSDKK
ncbi:MAG: hypothetical protein Kow00108_18500 [Calditrichia bacterium]